ncbi:FAD-dependent monooxygenase [Streptomyces mirabilis]|uniref:FAD-dependent monooxygenase n=1 Tax=Streptomyces mirabilis TaxID=68239 RepID=UPI000765EDE3|nr:FAD-dependent monooxygenase [Streptomyces mirabilis]MCX4428636.1 FAD-dependent monooxygenase [Streptomyces mirabilis]
MNQTGILIVGGGPVGLSAALLATQYGIPCTLIERFESPLRHPKARGVRTRAMELFQLWGLEEEIRAKAPGNPQFGFVYCESLTGREFGRTSAGGADEHQSPTGDCRIPQDELELILRQKVARTPGTDTRFGTALDAIEQDENGVRASVTDSRTGETQTLTADYVIAADGAASTVRAALGIEQDGEVLGFWQSVYWHGALADLTKARTAIQYLTADPDGGFVTVAPVDGAERWMTFRMRGRDEAHPGTLTDDEARLLVRTAVGEERPVDIISTATYQVAAKVARSYRSGRIFLAGDAAHTFPPTGGFGLNTGVQDAHNLVWKLALVRQGAATDDLLDTYERERRQVAQSNAEWSMENAARFDAVWDRISSGAPAGDPIARQRAHVVAVQRDLGFSYAAGGVAPDEPVDAPDRPAADLTAQVGRRAPYLLVLDGDWPTTTLDLFDRKISVVHGASGNQWVEAVRKVAKHFNVALTAYCAPGPDFDVHPEAFDELYRLDADGAMLIRPDGHVAWRSAPGDPRRAEDALTQAVGRLLGVLP